MGYSHPKSLWDLYQKEYIKPTTLEKALKVLDITDTQFYQDIVSDSPVEYGRKKFIEERIDDLEKIVATLQQQIDQRKN